jgi:hypothetical protein
VLLRNKIKRLNADAKILTKKIDGQLQLKLQAAQEKSRLALEKEKLGLQRDEGKKRKKREMIELEHLKKGEVARPSFQTLYHSCPQEDS